jgi:hypothetical protein
MISSQSLKTDGQFDRPFFPQNKNPPQGNPKKALWGIFMKRRNEQN